MANLQYVKNNRIRTELTSKKAAARQAVLSYGIPFGVALSAILELSGLAGGMFLVWPGVAACYAIAPTIVHNEIEERGACGEEYILKVLSTLPDEYTIFNEVKLKPSIGEKLWEIDYVAVGPNGVFVIEVKDFRGRLIGSARDQEWHLVKTGRRGTIYSKAIKNPVKQVKRYICLLSEALRAKSIDTWLTGVVALSRDNALNNIDCGENRDKINVIHGSDLAVFIQRSTGKKPDERIVAILAEQEVVK